jgi:3-methyladenine DNA glycosylase AlkD
MLEEFTARLELLRDPDRATAMSAYMRHQFAFLGIPAPLRQASNKAVFSSFGVKQKPLEPEFVLVLWQLPEREYQYTALDYLHFCHKRLEPDHLELLETLICSKSWWDTVDSLAPLVGIVVLRHPELLEQVDTWASHENFWLRRVAILYQLRYKRQTDVGRLFAAIVQNSLDKEFFIRKAIGWALREYARTDAKAVQDFVFDHPELSGLSRREALKHLEHHKTT